MPFYEFRCRECGARAEVFARSVSAAVEAPVCPTGAGGHTMERVMSRFAQHLDMSTRLADAEAKWGKQVDAAMGPEPDIRRYARRLDRPD